MTAPDRPGAVPPCEEDAGPLSERGWRATVVGVHVVSAAVWALAVGATLIGDSDGGRRAAVLTALVVLALAYVLAGARAIGGDRPALGAVYLLALVGTVGVLGLLAPGLLFVLFLGYPQVWFVTGGVPAGLAWTAALAIAGAVGPVTTAATGKTGTDTLISTGVSLVFSAALGLWVSRVIEVSAQRGALIAQLERTRAELATAHHERGCSPSGSGSPGTCTTRSRRATRASSSWRRRRPSRWAATRTAPGSGSG